MKKYIYNIVALLFVALGTTSCQKDDETKFSQLPDQRVQAKMAEYKQVLTQAPFGWQMFYSLGSNIEYLSYQIATFSADNTVTLHSPDLSKPITSEYKLIAKDDIELMFSTFNENLTIFSYPSERVPKGYGGDIEFNFKSVNARKNEVVLEGKKYKGKLILRKAKEEYKDFDRLKDFVKYLAEQRGGVRYMNLAVTHGLEGASEEKPVSIGLDLSSIAKAADYAYNYKNIFRNGRKMLYFSHTGMGLSSPIEIDGHQIQYFAYNREKQRYEIDRSDLKGYIYTSNLPVYYVPGVVNEFLDDYSLWFKASFGQPNTKYAQMRRQLPVIKGMVFVTDYNRRIPLFDEKGNPIYDSAFNHDYEKGEKLGNGLLFSFEEGNQFYFYFVPLEIEKLQEDRLRFKRKPKSEELCLPKEGEDAVAIANEIKDNPAFNDLIDYLCNPTGWYIKRTVESGQIDWDFVSIANPTEDNFHTRIK
ncbi:DUF4302 domain-containing protein [Capnocytophaga canimorsus]|uniref:DUF4302 domain-containing protein n=1 Tax=Capnocytophaga canimorsus TaxID=28188 RepID=UPI0037D7B52F